MNDNTENKNFDVYKVTNKLNGKYYIGVTTQSVGARVKQHLYKALSGSQYNFHIALAELGLENFTIEVIDSTDNLEEAKELEKYWIKKLHSNNSEYGYNSDCGGDIMFHTPESKAKISAIHKGKDMSKFYNSVLQYSLDGKFICEYDSLTNAEKKSGVSRASIIRSIKKQIKTFSKANPYIWVYKKDFPDVPLEIDPTGWTPKLRVRAVSQKFLEERDKCKKGNGVLNEARAVIQYDKFGNKLNEFNSIGEASRQTGVNRNSIRLYCQGYYDEKLKDSSFLKRINYIWKYKQ